MQDFFRKRRIFYITLLFSGVFLFLQFQPVFAGHDLEILLRNWFDKRQIEAIEKIDAAIQYEKEKQIERLQSAVQAELDRAAEELNQFTDVEIQKRTTRLQAYADELIANISIDETEKKDMINEELDAIIERAMAEMEKVRDEFISQLADQ